MAKEKKKQGKREGMKRMLIDLPEETYSQLSRLAAEETKILFPRYKRSFIKPFVQNQLIELANNS